MSIAASTTDTIYPVVPSCPLISLSKKMTPNLVIIHLPRERLPAQDIVSCDYFSESQEFFRVDICRLLEICSVLETLISF
jgi:hypothetical protein